ncbi:MAG: 16S rRNA (cytosine(967)-C(5))-methyltransferase RsmB [Thermodesulfobacteriota bacterium]|nr:16S rRNA (cytosine(967)-C(5))-methyltransferase RsmB [Thermodesulfobacteriota bacterium]
MNKDHLSSVSISRETALSLLNEREKKDIPLNYLLEDSFKLNPEIDQRDRSFITELVYGTIRWQGKIDWVISKFSHFKLEKIDPVVLNILRMGIYQCFFLDRVPQSAAVNEAVKLANIKGLKRTGNFVNGVLRNIIRDWEKIAYPSMQKDKAYAISINYSHPLWLVKKFLKLFGEKETIKLCEVNNKLPQMALRTNTLKISRHALMNKLKEAGCSTSTSIYSPEGIILEKPALLRKLELYTRGFFEIQNETSQLVSRLLEPEEGEFILDACAAPGNKTTHIAQLTNNKSRIIAVEINPKKIRNLKGNIKRLGINGVKVIMGDVTLKLKFLSEGELFDRILLDAPCSGLGTLRRCPDIKWKKQDKDLKRLSELQYKMLQNLAGYLKIGGVLLYSICTITQEEGPLVIQKFLKSRKDFKLISFSKSFAAYASSFTNSSGFFCSLPHKHNLDGFFAAKLVRSL